MRAFYDTDMASGFGMASNSDIVVVMSIEREYAVANEHGVPRDGVPAGYRIEHPPSIECVRLAGVHLQDAVRHEGYGDEPRHKHACMRGETGGEGSAATVCAQLEEVGERGVGRSRQRGRPHHEQFYNKNVEDSLVIGYSSLEIRPR
jgi:hypothetical protein